jgi:hypothetical protein
MNPLHPFDPHPTFLLLAILTIACRFCLYHLDAISGIHPSRDVSLHHKSRASLCLFMLCPSSLVTSQCVSLRIKSSLLLARLSRPTSGVPCDCIVPCRLLLRIDPEIDRPLAKGRELTLIAPSSSLRGRLRLQDVAVLLPPICDIS